MLAVSPAARVAVGLAAVVLVGMLAVLIAVLVSLEGTRSEIRTTRAGVVAADQRFQRVAEQLEPLLAATAPLAGDGARRRLRGTTVKLADSVEQLPALADRAKQGVEAATFIATTLDRSGLRKTFLAVRDGLSRIRALLGSQRALTHVSTRTQLSQLSITRRTFALLSESLAIQREILERTRSLDRKTGGPAPTTPLAPTPPTG